MPANPHSSAPRRVLSSELRERFAQRRNRVLARASRGHLALLAVGLMAFWGWDWWLDPVGAMQTWPLRLLLAGVYFSAIFWVRKLPDEALPWTYAGMFAGCTLGVGYAISLLDQGLLHGTAGIVVFLAVLAFYPIPPKLYLLTSGVVLALMAPLLHSQGASPRELFNYAVYHALFTWIGATAALMLMRQQLKVFLLPKFDS